MLLKKNPENNPVDAKSYYIRGNFHHDKGEYEEAIENYNMAILLNPSFSEAYFNRALSYYMLKEYEKAAQDYTEAAKLDPKNPQIYNNRGDVYYKKQDYKSAIKDYDRAIALNPEYKEAYYNRGLAYATLEEYDKAAEDFSKCIELDPDFAEAYYLRGLSNEYDGFFKKAAEDYEKAIALNPDLEEAKEHLDLVNEKISQSGSGSGDGKGKDSITLLEKPKTSFKDIAGMEPIKEEIRDAIVYPLKNPELAREYGKFGGGGILMYGPPGCGKTYIMKASAGECNASFINAKLSDLLDMYVGNTEKNIHKVFELARNNSPCILFFDEVDAIGGRRDQQQGAQYMRMAVNQMLYEMDGIEANNQNVLVVAATNAPWDVDPALRRSGRFSKPIFVGEPDFKSRMAILKLHGSKKPVDRNVKWWKVALATVGYSSADLKALVDEAATYPWKEALIKIEREKQKMIKQGLSKEEAEKKANEKVKRRKITSSDFLKALKKVKSSLPPWYEQAKKQIGKQEEVTIIDGKEHKRISESKLGPGERQQFKPLLDIINKKNQWHEKIKDKVIREMGKLLLYLPI